MDVSEHWSFHLENRELLPGLHRLHGALMDRMRHNVFNKLSVKIINHFTKFA